MSFPASAMTVPQADLPAVSEAAHQVIRDAKAAGVYVFGGGINENMAPVQVAANGSVSSQTYAQTRGLTGGFCVMELPSREAAIHWAARLAQACRCAQDVREFHDDPES